MTNTKVGRDTQEAEPRSTCSVCKGKRVLTGPVEGFSGAALHEATIYCPKCDGLGTVPAGDLAQWRADHLLLLEDVEYAVDIRAMQRHLAAMPQPDVNAALLGALERYESLEGMMDAEDVVLMNIQIERRRQRAKWGDEHDAQHTPEEWQALIVERMARPMPALEDDAYRIRLVEIAAMAVAALEARAAIAQAEKGAAR